MLVIPEAMVRDEYDNPADYLSKWGICIRNAHVPDIAALGRLEQKYDQNLQYNVTFDTGKEISATKFSDCIKAFPLTISGLFQQLETEGGAAAAYGPEGEPLLLQVTRGDGTVWYLGGTPERKSLSALLDAIYEKAGVTRHLKVTDLEGCRIDGLEARLVRREFEDLVYLVNGSGRDVDFTINVDRICQKVRELRRLKYYSKPSGTIKKGDVLIFSLQQDPSMRLCDKTDV